MNKATELTAMMIGLNVLLDNANKQKEKCYEDKDYKGCDSIQKSINEMYDAKMKYEKELIGMSDTIFDKLFD